ncbi:MAG: hypothetical protein CMH59_19465 [Myxococcales bacterium]|nr:hypothetical protein [Myxococcales bacterium]
MDPMDWDAHADTLARWREETTRYVDAINAFVEKGTREGWEAAGPEPEDGRDEALGRAVVDVVREANRAGAWRELRQRVPTAHRPLIPLLEERSLGMGSVCWLDDARVAATSGSPWQERTTRVYDVEGGARELEGVLFVARSPRRELFALVRPTRLTLHRDVDGPALLELPLPRGDEGLEGFEAPDGSQVLDAAPLPDGSGALVTTSAGVFLCRPGEVRRLFPTRAELAARREDAGGDDAHLHLDMLHAALSPDGALVACGSQDSSHLLLDLQGEVRASFGPIHSEYPHHAAFSPDGAFALFNSCHFYNGVTVGGAVDELFGLDLDAWEEDPRLVVVDAGARVYASAFLDGAFLLGDAGGYVNARTIGGEAVGRHFVGSSVGGLDVSPDGGFLAVATYAGFLSLIALGAGRGPHQIGTLPHREVLRFVQWRGESLWRW